MKPSNQEFDTKHNSNNIYITLDAISLPENDTNINRNVNVIRLASLQIHNYSQSYEDELTTTRFTNEHTVLNTNVPLNPNP